MDNNYYYNQENRQTYGSQNMGQLSGMGQNPGGQYGEQKKTEKKSGKAFPKFMMSACLGLLFGVFGGLGFFAVQKTTGLVGSGSETVTQNAPVNGQDSSSETTLDTATPQTQSVFNTISSTATHGTEASVSDVAEALMPAMVSIEKEYKYDYGNDIYSYYFGGGGSSTIATASGSGFIIAETDTEYLIVSNNHVVEDPISLTVTFDDGSTASAYLKGRDSSMDVAVIAVQKSDVSEETKQVIKIAAIGDSGSVRLGEQVVAIGNALGYGQSVTTGIVSAIDREITMDDGTTGIFIQTDAAINPGNSGGALINMNGEVIGINSSKIGGTAVEGMGYAIPISSVTDIIAEFMEHQTRIPIDESEMGYIGISLQEVTTSLSERFGIPVGIYVVDVTEDGGAKEAGLQTGDIITKFDGETIESYDDLQSILKYYAAGTTVKITYERQEGGRYVSHTVDLTLKTKPSESQ
ncbi:MAG: trypsin-like peptidase domain-containing protein [Lachnospiraceae bacterium]|nr:trypsin-like peptidase domain-containing protein [Lachnospiraceae bacterium]